MSSLAKNTRATVIPCMGYRNAPAAIEWLCNVFGFEKHAVYPGEGGTIMHSELSFGNGMIMCGSINDTPFVLHQTTRRDRRLRNPVCVCAGERRRRGLRTGQGGWRGDSHRYQNGKLRRPRLYVPRSRGAYLEFRDV